MVLTDIVMPGGANGLDLAREVRAARRRCRSCSPPATATRPRPRPNEGFAILRKPYSMNGLHDALREALAAAATAKVA